jgi:glucosamine-6-phosphate deaminase
MHPNLQDEYVGLPRDHVQSYRSFMFDHFFDHVDIDRDNNVHLLDGTAPDPEAECRRYEDAIARAGGVDLFLGGMGADGHVAFNEPGSSLASRTRVVTLARDTLVANSSFFGGDVNQVPRQALTVSVQTVMDVSNAGGSRTFISPTANLVSHVKSSSSPPASTKLGP